MLELDRRDASLGIFSSDADHFRCALQDGSAVGKGLVGKRRAGGVVDDRELHRVRLGGAGRVVRKEREGIGLVSIHVRRCCRKLEHGVDDVVVDQPAVPLDGIGGEIVLPVAVRRDVPDRESAKAARDLADGVLAAEIVDREIERAALRLVQEAWRKREGGAVLGRSYAEKQKKEEASCYEPSQRGLRSHASTSTTSTPIGY